MRNRWTMAALFCAMVFVAQPVRAEDCSVKRVVSLPITTPDRIVADVSIAGHPLHFLVDTGGVYSEINQNAADALKLKTLPVQNGVQIFHVNGTGGTRYTVAEDLSIGPLHAGRLPMLVANEPWGTDIDGILAPDFLSRFDLDFDFAAHALNLVAPDHCKGQVVYWAKAYAMSDFTTDGGHIRVPIVLDGRNLTAELDTGTAATSMEDLTVRRLFGIDENSPGVEKPADLTPGAVVRFSYRFKSLSMGGVGIANPLVYVYHNAGRDALMHGLDTMIANDPVYGQKVPDDLLLGMSVLSKLHLFVCYKELRLYMTGADAH